MYKYLYGIVYPKLAVHQGIRPDEVDANMKMFFYVGDKKFLTKGELKEFIQLVKAYALSVGCEIEDQDVKEKVLC